MKFDATYFDGVHPVGKAVTVAVISSGKTSIIGSEVSYACHWQDISVSHQLGTTPRYLQLPNGAKCESTFHQEINLLEKQNPRATFGKYLHRFESSWHYVLIAAVVVVGFTWSMINYGIPALANTVAQALPVSVDERLTEGTLTLLDEHILSPSDLEEETKQRLQYKFLEMVKNSQDEHHYQLLFRRGVGPNALALPSGHIVVTDELIEIADTDEEVLAVLAHEIGHVVHEHGLRSILQTSAVALLLTAVTGDVGSASGFAAAMPIILLETNYSRKFELEADQFALKYMRTHKIDTMHFATILQKITGDDEESDASAFSYLSTHPATFERIQPFKDNSITNK